MKHLLILPLLFSVLNLVEASILEYENTEACYACADHPQIIEKQLYEWEGYAIPREYRVIKQVWHHGCTPYKTLLYIYKGKHQVSVTRL